MRNLFVPFVMVLAMVLLTSPAQADPPCKGCENTEMVSPTDAATGIVAPMLPQGETDEIQPFKDHSWGGDPDDPTYGSWLDLIMCLAYWSPDCDVYYHQTIWCD